MRACIDCSAHAYNGILNRALLHLNENFEADFLQLYQAEFSPFPALHLRKVEIKGEQSSVVLKVDLKFQQKAVAR